MYKKWDGWGIGWMYCYWYAGGRKRAGVDGCIDMHVDERMVTGGVGGEAGEWADGWMIH